MTNLQTSIMLLIMKERSRQEELKAAGRFTHTMADLEGLTHQDRFVCLGEEHGEVAGAVSALTGISNDRMQDGRNDLRKELIHVAAVAVAWLEAIEKGA